MVKNVLVRLNYGPYESHGILRYKIQRLRGLIDFLKSGEYQLELNQTIHLNQLSIEMKDREIFRCDIRNLLFNMPSAEDPLCTKIIDIIKDHEKFYYTDRNIPQYANVNEGMRWEELENDTRSDVIKIETPYNSPRASGDELFMPSQPMIIHEDYIVPQIQYRPNEFCDFDVPFGIDHTVVSDDIEDAEECLESKSSSDATSSEEPTVCTGKPCFGCSPSQSLNGLLDPKNSTLS